MRCVHCETNGDSPSIAAIRNSEGGKMPPLLRGAIWKRPANTAVLVFFEDGKADWIFNPGIPELQLGETSCD